VTFYDWVGGALWREDAGEEVEIFWDVLVDVVI
jgi:hypothetical protein